MRIDFYGAAGAELDLMPTATKPAVGQTGSETSAIPQDTASLSSGGAAPLTFVEQALASADARATKVEALRQAVANAEYVLDPDLIANAMISSGA